MGLFAAFIAFLSWGFGDFAIQRAIRRVGSTPAIFAIGIFGAVVLFPFAMPHLGELFHTANVLFLLSTTVIITSVTAALDFEALRKGKLSVIEPVMSFELVITVLIGVLLLREAVTTTQLLLGIGVFTGILLTVIHREPRHWWKFWHHTTLLEPGVILAGIGAVAMSLTNIFTGLSSQVTNPVVTIWFIHTSIAFFGLLWFLLRGSLQSTLRSLIQNWKPVLAESVLDNAAWLAYATAVTLLPISVTIAITESYIVLAAFLGIRWNHERLQRHQFVGGGIALVAAIALAAVTN